MKLSETFTDILGRLVSYRRNNGKFEIKLENPDKSITFFTYYRRKSAVDHFRKLYKLKK